MSVQLETMPLFSSSSSFFPFFLADFSPKRQIGPDNWIVEDGF